LSRDRHPFGYEFLRSIEQFQTADVSAAIRQDVLLLAGNEDHYVPMAQWHRQIRMLKNARSVTARLFTRSEDAQNHCQAGNYGLALRTIVNWLDGMLAGAPETIRFAGALCAEGVDASAQLDCLKMENTMDTQVNYTPDFFVEVDGVKGMCPAGEIYARKQIAEKKIPVFSCEGPCIRGEIARQAANLVAKEVPSLARACHAETFFVPHSSMKRWIMDAEKAVVIDGCFLKCHGRVLKNLVQVDKVVHIDALPLYKKYGDVFLADDVPEDERKLVARQVADQVIDLLQQQGVR
jgi:uncharacterized metal-binding protein